MNKALTIISAFLAIMLGGVNMASAVQPTQAELSTRDRWVEAKFAGTQPEQQDEEGLAVIGNYGPLQQNSREGMPLTIGKETYTRGLYCHAISKIRVVLPRPGKSFSATVGIDTNGSYFGGSVEFYVLVDGEEIARTPVMRRDEPAMKLTADLGGATEFIIGITDGGDNINSDQASWADAKVTLSDGEEVWLGDMPIVPGVENSLNFDPPFSFVYGGKPSSDILASLELTREVEKVDEQRTQHTLTYKVPATGLVVRCLAVTYNDFPTVEWTLYLENTGGDDTPILENIQALDTLFTRGTQSEFELHHFVGSPCLQKDYQPLQMTLGFEAQKRIAGLLGRPTSSDLPYFNIERPGGGIIVVVSWAGQWAAEFKRDESAGLNVSPNYSHLLT